MFGAAHRSAGISLQRGGQMCIRDRAQGAGLNLAAVSAAVIGGAYFGDNLSMISDTTISAAQGCGSEMRDKFRMNFFIALPAALAALVLYGIVGGGGQGAIQAGPFDVIRVLPYVAVLATAVMGLNVAVVLFLGILLTGVIGLAQGTVGFLSLIHIFRPSPSPCAPPSLRRNSRPRSVSPVL